MASFSRGLRWLVAAFREMNQTANKLAISTQAQTNGNDMALMLLVGKAGMDGTEYWRTF
jgi:predicted component of type VI protein secretion system